MTHRQARRSLGSRAARRMSTKLNTSGIQLGAARRKAVRPRPASRVARLMQEQG